MKVIVTIFFILALSSLTYGQITITNQQAIQPNDSIYFSELNPTGFNPGNAGANVLWDFSNFSVIGLNSYFTRYLSTTNPSCNLDTVNLYSPSINYTLPSYKRYYYYVDSTQLTDKGFCLNDGPWNSGTQSYTDPPLLMSFPFNYLDSYTDSSIGILQGVGSIWQTNGTITNYYDAYGELRLPWAIFPNTARLQTTRFRRDTIVNSTMGGGEVRIYSTVGYEWYDLNVHNSLFGYYESTSTHIPFGGTPTTTFYKALRGQVKYPVGINNSISSLNNVNIFPNPSSGMFNIEVPVSFKNQKYLQIIVFNSLGKEIVNLNELNNAASIKLDLSDQVEGLYYVSLISGKEIITKKIAIQ